MSEGVPRFPLLRTAEIVECLIELSIQVQEKDIKRPNAETIRVVYERFLELLTGLNRDDLANPAFGAVELLSFPELHEHSVGEVAFLRRVSDMMRVSDVPDFRLSDLFQPEAKRTRRNLSALINFAKYREQRVVTYQELAERSQGKVAQRTALEAQTEALSEKLNIAKRKRSKEAAETERLTTEADELQVEIKEMNQRQAELHAEAKEEKNIALTLTKTITDLKEDLVQLNEQCNKLAGQIVDNPDKLKASMAEMAKAVESEKAARAKAEAQQRHLSQRLDRLGLVERDMNKVHEMVREVEHEVGKVKKAYASIKEQRVLEAEKDEAVHDMRVRVEQVLRQNKAAQERLFRSTSSGKRRIEEAEQGLDSLRSERLAMEKQRATHEAKIEANNAAMASLRRDMDDINSEHADAMRAMHDEYSQLKENLDQYHVAIFSSMLSSTSS